MESHKACFLRKHVFTGLIWLSTQRRSFGLKATLSRLEGELTISSTSAKEQQEKMGAVCSLSSSNASEQPVFFCRFFYSSQCLDFHLSFLLPFLKVFKAFFYFILLWTVFLLLLCLSHHLPILLHLPLWSFPFLSSLPMTFSCYFLLRCLLVPSVLLSLHVSLLNLFFFSFTFLLFLFLSLFFSFTFAFMY